MSVFVKIGKRKKYLVHRLVIEAFIGPIPEGLVVNHVNEIKIDNRIENLEIITHRENITHGTAMQRARETRQGLREPSKAAIYHRKYRAENREKCRDYGRDYRSKNLEKIREYKREYYQNNIEYREKNREYMRKYRAKKKLETELSNN